MQAVEIWDECEFDSDSNEDRSRASESAQMKADLGEFFYTADELIHKHENRNTTIDFSYACIGSLAVDHVRKWGDIGNWSDQNCSVVTVQVIEPHIASSTKEAIGVNYFTGAIALGNEFLRNNPAEAKQEPETVEVRIRELANFAPNWNGHDGQPLLEIVMDRALALFDSMPAIPDNLFLYPSPAGALIFEFDAHKTRFTGVIEQSYCMLSRPFEEPMIFEDDATHGIDRLLETLKSITRA